MLVDLEVDEGAGGPTLVGTHEVVDRRVVVDVASVVRQQAVVGLQAEPVLVHVVDRVAVGVDRVDEEVRDDRRRRTAAGRAGRAQGAARVVARFLAKLVVLAPGQVDGRVAAAIGEVAASHQVDVVGFAVEAGITRRVVEPATIHQFLDVAVAVVVLVSTVTGTHFHAVHATHDEVHHARDSVGAVGGGGAARQHFDALDHRRGDLVDVDVLGVHAAGLEALAVDQDQGAVGAQAAQVKAGRTGRTVRNERGLRRFDLRQAVQYVLDAGQTGGRDFFQANHGNRAGLAEAVVSLQARTRNDDFLDQQVFGIVFGLLILGHDLAGDHRERGEPEYGGNRQAQSLLLMHRITPV